ncbi:hypothetical protein CORC01_12762 [Colletotrichum orchidophilum]|uniref:Secreted protein n=1 Tax=Colletotrichum orchidophilum TaxID=1209926 RepID=A0A1G4ASA2_9PEZI|nr:uncharacterized protein CORC01_12762 [Colletotrichum orchidophilum]OHE91912.1 hypothetical protein CORC01_12762 [Colletotrichum orchidophilum]
MRMRFSTAMITFFLAAATGVAAKHHIQLYCTTASGSGQFIFLFPVSSPSCPNRKSQARKPIVNYNDDVTNKVCPIFFSD